MACTEPAPQLSPPFGAVTVTVGASSSTIEKLVALESRAVLPAASRAMIRTRTVPLGVFGTVQAREPVLAIPVAITFGKLVPPLVEYARSTDVTDTLSLAFQVMVRAEPVSQISPPSGAVRSTVGGVAVGDGEVGVRRVAGGVAGRIAAR